jgi:RecA-family ATPase
MAQNLEAPRWLIEGIWTAGSHGILGGEPKTSKSTLALAMGLAIASGRPFLGKYEVGVQGPVLMVQEENREWVMQERMRKIARFYGLIRGDDAVVEEGREGDAAARTTIYFPDDVPFHLVNRKGFSMDREDQRELLIGEIQRLEPIMVILDPLYYMIGEAQVERGHEIAPYLKWIARVGEEYKMAPLIIHHFRKAARDGSESMIRGGQRMLGSAQLHAWTEAALYAEKLENDGRGRLGVRLEREFRNAGTKRDLEIRLAMGEPGTLDFGAQVMEYNLEGQLTALVAESEGQEITTAYAAEVLGKNKRTIERWAIGSEELIVERGKRGRGHTTRIRLA